MTAGGIRKYEEKREASRLQRSSSSCRNNEHALMSVRIVSMCNELSNQLCISVRI